MVLTAISRGGRGHTGSSRGWLCSSPWARVLLLLLLLLSPLPPSWPRPLRTNLWIRPPFFPLSPAGVSECVWRAWVDARPSLWLWPSRNNPSLLLSHTPFPRQQLPSPLALLLLRILFCCSFDSPPHTSSAAASDGAGRLHRPFAGEDCRGKRSHKPTRLLVSVESFPAAGARAPPVVGRFCSRKRRPAARVAPEHSRHYSHIHTSRTGHL
jgi:hypothetical protein